MNKKLFLSVLLCLALTFSLAACGSGESDVESESESVSETSEESEIVEVTSESEVEEETEETSEVSEVEDETEETSEASEVEEETETGSTTGSADIADAIYGADTTDENAIPLGTWGEISRYSTGDGLYHTVYVRVTNVTSYADDADYVQAAIDLNNENSYDWGQIDLSSDDYQLPSDVQWHLMEYEVYVPENFPSGMDDGSINEPSFSFWAENIGGGGIPSADGTSTYISLGWPEELECYDSYTRFYPGNTYSFSTLYAMVEGYEDYVFYETFYADGTDEDMLYVYYACK